MVADWKLNPEQGNGDYDLKKMSASSHFRSCISWFSIYDYRNFLLGPIHTGWLFTEMASKTSAVLGWIWGLHLCVTSLFLLDFMNHLTLYVLWISSLAYLLHSPHMEGERSDAQLSGVGEWTIKTDW